MKNNDYNLNDESNLPLDNNGKNPFGLPMDYFSKFEDNLKRKIEFEDELKEFPLLSSIQKTNLFTTPETYFNSVTNRLEYQAELESYSTLYTAKKPVFTDLEEEYVKQFHSSLDYKIELTEELKSYNMLYSMDKVYPFTVSEDYFENVATTIKERIYSAGKTKHSVLDKVLDLIFGKTMAFSFGLAFIIGLAFCFNQHSETIVESGEGDCKTLACLERQEILNNNKVITNLDEDQLMDLVDVNTLNKQLNSKKENTNSSVTKKVNLDSINEEDVLDEL
ncbi:MAG: hypothetical protein HY062_04885 [Bacteroidetes bacterium]|nr:hypothetical protein [Bacteroidota bacterium]